MSSSIKCSELDVNLRVEGVVEVAPEWKSPPSLLRLPPPPEPTWPPDPRTACCCLMGDLDEVETKLASRTFVFFGVVVLV